MNAKTPYNQQQGRQIYKEDRHIGGIGSSETRLSGSEDDHFIVSAKGLPAELQA